MKPVLLLALIILLNITVNAQKISLYFKSSNSYIPYVNVFDTSRNLAYASDSTGVLKLEVGSYNFCVTHVSFSNSYLHISRPRVDTSIYVRLIEKENPITGVVVQSKSKQKLGESYEFGTYSKKSNGSTVLAAHLKLGYYLSNYTPDQKKLLKGLKFRLENLKEINAYGDNLEVKIFKISNKLVDTIPLNKQPLYIKLNELAKKNIILISEKIDFPKEGIFISFELPQIIGLQKSLKIEFTGKWKEDDCHTYVMKNNRPSWNINTLKFSCGNNILTNKKFTLNLNALCQNYLEAK